MRKQPPYAKLHRAAGEQKFITRAHARELGMSDSTFDAHMARIGWDSPMPRVWVPSGTTLDHRSLARACVAVYGAALKLTGASALFFHDVLDAPPETLELLIESNRSLAPRDGICIHRTVTFEGIRVVRKGDLNVVAAPRAFADYAQHTTTTRLCRDIATALRKRRCTLNAIDAEVQRRGRFPGRRSLRCAVMMLRDETTHSRYERIARRHVCAAGLRPVSGPFTVEVRGTVIGEIDIAFPDAKYGVEIDGPHHLLPQVAAADRQRDRRLAREGWTIDRFFWFEIEDRPEWVVEQVIRRLREQRSLHVPSGVSPDRSG